MSAGRGSRNNANVRLIDRDALFHFNEVSAKGE